MIYSDDELKRWWQQLSKSRQAELLATMIDKAYQPDFAVSLAKQYEQGRELSPKQLATIKKWDR